MDRILIATLLLGGCATVQTPDCRGDRRDDRLRGDCSARDDAAGHPRTSRETPEGPGAEPDGGGDPEDPGHDDPGHDPADDTPEERERHHPDNGHGNDADGNDDSNPGHSSDPDDDTDDDGEPGRT